jgi:hypothetical protein
MRSSLRDQGELLKIGPVPIDREEAVIESDSRAWRSPSAEVRTLCHNEPCWRRVKDRRIAGLHQAYRQDPSQLLQQGIAA